MKPHQGLSERYQRRALDVTLACKLTHAYGKYHVDAWGGWGLSSNKNYPKFWEFRGKQINKFWGNWKNSMRCKIEFSIYTHKRIPTSVCCHHWYNRPPCFSNSFQKSIAFIKRNWGFPVNWRFKRLYWAETTTQSQELCWRYDTRWCGLMLKLPVTASLNDVLP